MRGEAVGKIAGIMQLTGSFAADVFGLIVEIEEIPAVRQRGRGYADVLARILAWRVLGESGIPILGDSPVAHLSLTLLFLLVDIDQHKVVYQFPRLLDGMRRKPTVGDHRVDLIETGEQRQ